MEENKNLQPIQLQTYQQILLNEGLGSVCLSQSVATHNDYKLNKHYINYTSYTLNSTYMPNNLLMKATL